MDNSQCLTKEQVINELALLDKSPGSIKNLQSGFNQMIKKGQLDEFDLINEFSFNFEQTLSRIRSYSSRTNSRHSWPSFLTDIQYVINNITLFDISDLNFSEALYQLTKKRFGKLSKTEISRKVSEDIGVFVSSTTVRDWLLNRTIPRSIDSHKSIKKIDQFFNCNGNLYKKIPPLQVGTNNASKDKKEESFVIPINFEAELDQYLLYRKDKVSPTGRKSLIDNIPKISIRKKRACKRIKSKKISKATGERRKKLVVLFLRYILVEKGKDVLADITLNDLFNLDYLDGFVHYCINRGTITSCEGFLSFILSEARKNTFSSVYLDGGFDNYDDWIEHLNDVNEEIKDIHYVDIEDLDNDHLDGARNIKFILHNNDPFALVNKISKRLWLTASSFERVITPSTYISFNVALMFDILCFCPLRIKNYCQIRLLSESVTDLEISRFRLDVAYLYYHEEKKCYGLYVGKTLLKNKKSKKISSINQHLEHLTDKINKFILVREEFVNKNGISSDALNFATRNSTRKGVVISQIGDIKNPDSHSTTFKNRTKKAIKLLGIKNEFGINPHGMRHLSASLYLIDNPENYSGLSTLLMDDLATVIRVYAKRADKQNAVKISGWGSRRFGEAA